MTSLLKDKLIADSQDVLKSVKRQFENKDQLDQSENVHRVMLVTSDERVPELIETVNNFTSKLSSDVPLDLIVT